MAHRYKGMTKRKLCEYLYHYPTIKTLSLWPYDQFGYDLFDPYYAVKASPKTSDNCCWADGWFPLWNMLQTLNTTKLIHRSHPLSIICVQYTEGFSVHLGISWLHLDVFSTWVAGIMILVGVSSVHYRMFSGSQEYHEYIGEIRWFMWESSLVKAIYLYGEALCTEHPLMYRTFPNVLIVISWFAYDVLPMSSLMFSLCLPHERWHPRCTEHPPVCTRYSLDVFVIFFRCSENPDWLNILWCAEHWLFLSVTYVWKFIQQPSLQLQH